MKNEQVEFSSHSDTSTIVVQYIWPNISELYIYEAKQMKAKTIYTVKSRIHISYSPSTTRTDFSFNPWLSRCNLRSFVLCDCRHEETVRDWE
jgi:hypothetical protein